ncbi:MAG: 23S rRNA (guanosine(2251)-2'-O)-methyltransferase RlmB [Pseudomonadota bacterium]
MTGREQKLLTGINAAQSALRNDPGNVVRLEVAADRSDRRIDELKALAAAAAVPVVPVGRRQLDQAGRGHQGVVTHYQALKPLDESGMVEALATVDNPLVLVLDHLSDPRNFGACLRSAAAAGADLVVYPKDRAVDLTPAARKTAAGGAEQVTLARVVNLGRALDQLKSAGLWIAGAAGTASRSVYDLDLTGPIALVLGSEERGLKRLVRERCDHHVSIPIDPRMESLNVSVAAAVMLFEARRQRQAAGPGA